MRPNPSWLAAAIFVLGFALRTAPLTQNRFHPDEALYATFSRLIASGRDPMLSGVVVDKPPLPFYITAASMAVFGGTEFAARLPALFASTLTVPLLYRLARALYDGAAAAIAALALALSPMAISFATTLFTDTFLTAFVALTLFLAARRGWAAAGWAFGLAFACKQSALFFLPLVVVVGLLSFFHHRAHSGRGEAGRSVIAADSVLSAVKHFLIPAAICAAAVFLWDFARRAPVPFWTQGYVDNNPGRLVRSNEIWPRLRAWMDLLQYPIPPLGAIPLALGLPVLLASGRRSLPALCDYALTAFALTFLAGYWLLAFNVWDRYLVALTPILALLFARVVVFAANRLSPIVSRSLPPAGRRLSLAACVLSAFFFLPPAILAAQSRVPIGGDHGAYDGIDQIARVLQTAPPGSVLYDHWLSWELGFYSFGGPAYIAWMPGPGTLAEDLRAFGRSSPRYMVAPSWESFAEMRAAIESSGFTVQIVKQTYRRDGSLSFTLYRILPETGVRSRESEAGSQNEYANFSLPKSAP